MNKPQASSPRTVRISAGQLSTVVEGASFEEKQRKTLDEIISMIGIAGSEKSDLILFGEYANLHHRTWSTDLKEYIPGEIPGPFTKEVAAAARSAKTNVAVPMFATYHNVLSSYVVLIDRKGEIVGCYQKAHPTIAEQNLGIRGGDDLTVYDLDFGRVGIMTCMDIEYPEVAQVLMLRGAELLLFPHVQASWGEEDWEIRYRTRAIDTGLPMISACFGYAEGEWRPGKMIGRSGIIGRDGGILAEKRREIGVVSCTLDLNRKRLTEFYFPEKLDRTLAVRASRRPELYQDLASIRLKQEAEEEVRRRNQDKK